MSTPRKPRRPKDHLKVIATQPAATVDTTPGTDADPNLPRARKLIAAIERLGAEVNVGYIDGLAERDCLRALVADGKATQQEVAAHVYAARVRLLELALHEAEVQRATQSAPKLATARSLSEAVARAASGPLVGPGDRIGG